MRCLSVLLFVFILASCTGPKNVTVAESPTSPEWATSRPISADYYIGIAKSSKSNADYQSVAKQNALVDLSSEISVKLSSESIFHQVDKGDSYREDYQSLIQIESHKNLEGYTLVASWENDKEYWLYYQLSKTEWARIRAERKQKAIDEAYTYYQLAEKYLVEENTVSSIHYAVKALDALKLYMNEPLMHTELEYPLDVYCFQFLAEVHSSIIYEVDEGAQHREVVLMGSDISLEPFDVYIGKANVPFKIRSSFKGVPNQVLSNDDGFVKVRAQEMNVYRKNHFVSFTLDWDGMLKEANASPWLNTLLDFPENSFKITVNTLWPKIAISSEELNLGESMSQSILLNEATNYLKEKDFEIVDISEADLLISISANTNKGLTNNRMHTAMLEYEFVVKNSSGKVIYQKQERALKGVQASFLTAGVNAYERSLDEFKWDVLRPFLKYLEGE